MMTKDKRIIAIILMFVLLCVCALGQPFVANADTNSKKHLKYSAILTDESFYVDKNESYAGYTYEYLNKLEEYGNYDIEIVECGTNTNESINKAFDLVETGECDITGLVLKNDYTMEHYELVDVPYGTRYQVLAALSSDFSLTEENVLIQKPLKIGAIETGKYARRLMTTYLDALGVEYEITPLKDFAELYDALEKKEVHVVLTNSLAPIKGTRIVEKYSGEPYYFALKKGNVALKNELEAVIRQIESSDSVVQERLFKKYFSNIEYKFGLNQEEKVFVAENQTWRAIIDDEVAPLFYVENGV
ncbi:MAG: transporter substrate-binding domain-containing protein, partial [Clostridia bacterium]